MFRAVLLFFIFSLAACGTYRTNSDYVSAVGTYRPPSDYSQGVEARNSPELRDPRGQLSKGSNYVPSGAFKLYWPVASVRINRGFRPESDPHHEGLDLGGKRGTPVLAAHEGVVIYAGHAFSGYGNMVLIEFNHEWATLYGHLDDFAVREGRIVMPGDPIGAMGSTGHATGVHLHFELMHNRTPIDPLPLLSNGRQLASDLQKRKQRAKIHTKRRRTI